MFILDKNVVQYHERELHIRHLKSTRFSSKFTENVNGTHEQAHFYAFMHNIDSDSFMGLILMWSLLKLNLTLSQNGKFFLFTIVNSQQGTYLNISQVFIDFVYSFFTFVFTVKKLELQQ